MNDQIYEQASEWVVRNRSITPDQSSRAEFDDWLRRSPENIQAYLEMSSIWETMPGVASDGAQSADALASLLQQGESTVVALRPATRREIGKRDARREELPVQIAGAARRRLLSAAAAVTLAIAGTWLWTSRETYETGVGEQRSLVLEDGSRIEINSRSRVRVRYSAASRNVELLEGQALFEVARNPARPFVVRSGDAYLRAVGTQFDVYRKKHGTVVTVVEGKVAVLPTKSGAANLGVEGFARSEPVERPSRRPTEVLVLAGEQMTVQPTASARPHPANVEAALAWTRRSLVFDAAPLPQVAAEFNRYSKRQIVLVGPMPEALRISGVFSSSDPTVLLRFLRAQPELQVENDGAEIRIRYP